MFQSRGGMPLATVNVRRQFAAVLDINDHDKVSIAAGAAQQDGYRSSGRKPDGHRMRRRWQGMTAERGGTHVVPAPLKGLINACRHTVGAF